MPQHLQHRVSIRRTVVALVLGVACVLAASPSTSVAATAAGVITTPEQREAAAVAAEAQVGTPYELGGMAPGGFDCSGLVTFAFETAGVPLMARTSYELRRIGAPVSRRGLRRGDLVFTWDRTFGHVGIYLGAGRYVHAPGAGRRVQIAVLPARGGWFGGIRP